jgi:hypothetical protein
MSHQVKMAKARRNRMLIRLATAVAAAAVVAVGLYAAVSLTGNNVSKPIPPADTSTPTQSPTPETSPTATETPDAVSERCSASGLRGGADTYPVSQPDLPPAVEEMRGRIVDAALRCDFEALTTLALEGRDFFSFSFGDPEEEPGEFWRNSENAKPALRQPVLSLLVQTFDLSYCTDRFDDPDGEGTVTSYTWPAASCTDPTDKDWAELESLYSDEEIEAWKDFGSFIGWRIDVLDDGDWTSYIAGD